jgi:hypothetical protein
MGITSPLMKSSPNMIDAKFPMCKEVGMAGLLYAVFF